MMVVMILVVAGACAANLGELKQEAIAARDEAEELWGHGDRGRAVATLESISARWSGVERAARSAESDAMADLLETAQFSVAMARATLGSLLLEKDPKRAIEVLGPTCPTLWFFSRRASPGDEHVRGEVGWVRCYGDLVAAHRKRGEVMAARVIERDVVTHSTRWLREKRDLKASKAVDGRSKRRRVHELRSRWPFETPRLRSPRSATKPPRNASRAARNERRVRTLVYLSRISSLSRGERAVTARDFTRATTKAREVRRDLDAIAEAFCDASSDALHRARVLKLLRDAAAAATKDVLPEDQPSREEEEEEEDVEEVARWKAGVALAAMLRASQEKTAPTNWSDASTLEVALDALVSPQQQQQQQHKSSTTTTTTTTKPFGRAFAQHVAAEAAEYVEVASGVHQHGWPWLQRELTNLEDRARRLQLAIAPAAGPPPGFVGRHDILLVFNALRARAFKRSADPPPPPQQPKRYNNPIKPVEVTSADEVTTVRSAALVAFGVVALSAVHGTALLREQHRKDNDGYARRKPKRSLAESFRAAIAHLCLAVAVCALAFWNRIKKTLPPVKDDAEQLVAALDALLTVLRRPPKKQQPSKQHPPSSRVRKVSTDDDENHPREEEEEEEKEEPPKEEEEDPAPADTYVVSEEDSSSSVHDDASRDSSPPPEFADEWQPVPKGGRVAAGPRILATKQQQQQQDAPPREAANNVGVSKPPPKKVVEPNKQQPAAAAAAKPPQQSPRAAFKPQRKKPPAPKSPRAANWSSKDRSKRQKQEAQAWGVFAPIPAAVVDPSRAASPESAVSDRLSLEDAIRNQVEYYFSVSNLCKDLYLRTHCMDSCGFVTLGHISCFKRVRALTDDLNVVRNALKLSSKLEFFDAKRPEDCKVRTIDQPERWVPVVVINNANVPPLIDPDATPASAAAAAT
ncbi:hypothetical protein CTAYLR_003334 [Chrysophaeum taylorii]|uniref:HTH La-type RNA-binding domain-containing protein n=1 Tax=Chrysophaeum taylorii TaxID=2483200 RepID=A0AAD7XQP6_9STRA|nr:hypothetical protein CTAYLR_003334 [Chrysophaeum taylorii]